MKSFRAIFNDNSEIVLLVENKTEAQIMAENDAKRRGIRVVSVKMEYEKNAGHYHIYRRR